MTVWQIACGAAGRRYSDLFIAHDVMFMGPGRYGEFDDKEYRRQVDDGQETANKVGQIRSLCNDVQPGDRVLLREGQRVVALGVVAPDGYAWCEAFDDVHGWDLQHTQRVCWQTHLGDELEAIQSREGSLFGDRKMIPTFTRVNDARVLDPVRHLFDSDTMHELKPLPRVPKPMSLDDVGEALFSRGLPYQSVDQVLAAFKRQRQLLAWYDEHGWASGRPTEHEVVAYMVLPLLRALGWSEQWLAIEWNKVDLAAFNDTPTTKERCVMLCEAKRRNHGLQNVWAQARGYVDELGLTGCRQILLTGGTRFYLYRRQGMTWEDEPAPAGYFNIRKLRRQHVVPTDTDAIETIMNLTPIHS